MFGCGTDEVLHLINQVFLEPGDNIVQGQYGFAAYAIGARACQARGPPRAGALPHRCRRDAEAGRRAHAAGVHRQSGQPDRHLDLRRGGPPPARRPAARCVLVLDGAYAEFATDPSFDDGLDLARGSANVIVTRTFSKLHGLAALRVGWAYATAPIADAIDRIRLPFNTSIPARRRPSPRWATRISSAAPSSTWTAGGPGWPSSSAGWAWRSRPRRPTSSWSASRPRRADRRRGRGLPGRPGPHRARRRQLRPARPPAHHHRPGRAQPRRGRGPGRVPGPADAWPSPSSRSWR